MRFLRGLTTFAGTVLLLFWARQFPALEDWVPFFSTMLAAIMLYLYGWYLQAAPDTLTPSWRITRPIGLTYICGRPNGRIDVVQACVQLSSIAVAFGGTFGFLVHPPSAGIIGVLAGVVTGIVLTLVIGLYRIGRMMFSRD